MTKSSKLIVGVGSAALALIMVLAILSSVKSSLEKSCEVCITFNGRTSCASAFAETEAEAIETATTTACASIAGGMTDSIQCGNTRPDSVTCPAE